MTNHIINQLNQIKKAVPHHNASARALIHNITIICQTKFNIKKFYNELGLISKSDAVDLLNNNIIAAQRQHDLSDAEYFREQKFLLKPTVTYFMETIHGCHIAPTVHPVTKQDLIDMINIIEDKFK